MKSLALSFLTLLFKLALSEPYNCPLLTCHETLSKDRCLEINYELPKDQHIRFGKCRGNKVCNYKQDSTYLWPVKPTEFKTKTDISTHSLWGYCVDANSWEVGNLMPGRKCNYDYQCYSNLCEEGKCSGLQYPAICRDSRDCDVGYRCAPDTTYKTS